MSEVDAAARERILTSLDESLLVEAAAGTGKTTVLVRRLVALLASGRTTVDRVVAVTFTRKAAGELQLRLREVLDRRRSASEGQERSRLQDAIARLEEARIGTIHSFCAELLRARPVEAGVDPAFVELDEEQAAQLFAQSFDLWIQDALAAGSPGESSALSRALARLSLAAPGGDPPLARLRSAAWQTAEFRDHPRPWRREPFDRAGELDRLVGDVAALAAAAAEGPPEHDLRRALRPVEEESRWIERAETAAGKRDLDLLEARLLALLRQLNQAAHKRRGSGKKYGKLERADVVAAREALIARLGEFKRRADADLAAALRETLAGSLDAYAERKRKEGKLDFLDLLLLSRDLLKSRPDVRNALQERFTHLFVDEVQDTDPLQAEVLLLLAADDPAQSDWRQVRPRPGKLFLVGDPKQSIYRFRRADVGLYQDLAARLVAQGVARLELTASFRSTRSIQQLVNAAFAPAMTGDAESGQPRYIPLAEQRPDPAGQPSVLALPVPFPLGRSGGLLGMGIEKWQPGTVAAFLRWLFDDSGWTVEDVESGAQVAIQPRHVAILFRRFLHWGSDVSHPYVRELEARNIPHVLLGGRSFHQREEVETLRTALHAVEHPDDELSVFATLKGDLFAVGDEALLLWRHRVGSFHPFRPLPPDLPTALGPTAQALALLADLHRRRNRVPVVETLHELLRRTRALAGFAVRPAGHQVVANVQHVAELARAFEGRGGLSFRRFVELLDEQAEASDSRQAPAIEEGAEGVRILSVHSAKGLEFPVVILADLTARLARDEPSRLVDGERSLWAAPLLGWTPWDLHDHAEREQKRDAAEGTRLAYVAATRARDLLVVPTTGVGVWESGWLADLDHALQPAPERSHLAEVAPGLHTIGDKTVLGVPEGYSGELHRSVRPGLHRAARGGHPVVWFDPALLTLDSTENFGVRQQHLLAEPADGSVVASDLEAYERWRLGRDGARARGAAPSVDVRVVTALVDDAPAAVESVIAESVERQPGRPAGARFGTLVHAVLRDVPLAAERPQVDALAAVHGRLFAATAEEVAAASEAVTRTLAHPLMLKAAGAEAAMQRELPFCLQRDDGTLVEGVIDLLFRDEAGWVVVDFKTDDIALAQEKYRRQLGWYAWAVSQLLGEPARCVLLAV